jgi:hypothetical protein
MSPTEQQMMSPTEQQMMSPTEQQMMSPTEQQMRPAQQPMRPVQQPMRPAQQPMRPVQQPMRPVQQPMRPTADQPMRPAQQPMRPTADQPMRPAQQPMMIPTQQPMMTPTQQPMRPTADQPMRPTADQPMRQTADQPMRPTADQPMRPTADQPMMRPTQQPIRPVHQPMRSVQQPMRPTADQPMRPTADQPMMTPTQQSITDKSVYIESQNAKKYIIEDVQNRGGNTYDVDSVQYQQDGIQNEEDDNVLDNNIFRMSVGNRSVVNKFIESGGKYYGDILTRSTNAPSKFQAASNELKYGDFNYIAPLNKGMINPAYTFVSPTNWYPIPPHPPVCVTNKRCTTSPVIISDGKDYMNFASLEDFDASRRFTGDMGINIDYIKNVLNNADGN